MAAWRKVWGSNPGRCYPLRLSKPLHCLSANLPSAGSRSSVIHRLGGLHGTTRRWFLLSLHQPTPKGAGPDVSIVIPAGRPTGTGGGIRTHKRLGLSQTGFPVSVTPAWGRSRGSSVPETPLSASPATANSTDEATFSCPIPRSRTEGGSRTHKRSGLSRSGMPVPVTSAKTGSVGRNGTAFPLKPWHSSAPSPRYQRTSAPALGHRAAPRRGR